MASNTNRKILLKGSERDTEYEEFVLNAEATPGHIMERMSTGKIRKHATAGGRWLPMVLVNDRLQGKTIDDAVAANALAFVFFPQRGDVINCLVAAAAPDIVIGDWIESAGDGTVRKFVGLTDSSGGTANTTLQDIGASHVEAEIANNFADLAAAYNATKGNSFGQAEEAVANSGGATAVRLAVRIA